MNPRKFKIALRFSLDKFEEYLQIERFEHHGLFNFMVRAMKFSYEYYPTNYTDSRLLPNGTWTGLTGLLNRSEVDFVPKPTVVTEKEWDAMAINYPYSFGEITFASRKPSYHPETMAIFRTLSAPVWLSLLVSILLVTLVTFVVLRYRHALDDVALHVLAVGLVQGGSIVPQRVGESMLLLTWMVAMALFTACFRSVLLSFLSFPPLTGIRTVPELAAAIRVGKYRATSYEGNFVPLYLRESTNEDIRLIGEDTSRNPPANLKDLLNKTFNPNVVNVMQRSKLDFLKEKIYVSKDNMGFYLLATAVRKNFCCKDEMDMVIHRFLAAGIDQKIRSFQDFRLAFIYFSKLLDEDGGTSVRKITLTDISGALIILIAGYVLSACLLMIELLVKRLEMRRSPNA